MRVFTVNTLWDFPDELQVFPSLYHAPPPLSSKTFIPKTYFLSLCRRMLSLREKSTGFDSKCPPQF